MQSDFDRVSERLGLSNDTGNNEAIGIIAEDKADDLNKANINCKNKLIPSSKEISFSSASIFPDVKSLMAYLKENNIKTGINWLHVTVAVAVGLGAGYIIKSKM